MKKKRWAAFLLSAAAAAGCLFALPGPAGARAEAVTAETELPEGDPAFEDGPLLSPEAVEAIKRLIDEVDVNELCDIAIEAWGVANTEEFQRLMEYPEMQGLAKAAFKKVIEVAAEDPEMAKEILVTLGIEKDYVQLLEELIKTANAVEPKLIESLLGSL